MRILWTLVLGILLAGIPDRAGAVQAAGAPASAVQTGIPDSTHRTPVNISDSIRKVPESAPTAGRTPVAGVAPKDTAASAPNGSKSRSDTVLVVKHHFNHRQQIITGSVIMSCLMLMMVTMNNYNPR